MTDDRVVAKLSSDEPKCANCAHWHAANDAQAGDCRRNHTKTLDLAVCSAWTDEIDDAGEPTL